MDPATEIGPLATAPIRDELAEQVERSVAAGAQAAAGRQEPRRARATSTRRRCSPSRCPGSPACDEELFGPVAALFRVADLDEAIALANDTVFGLGASAWTHDARASRSASRRDRGRRGLRQRHGEVRPAPAVRRHQALGLRPRALARTASASSSTSRPSGSLRIPADPRTERLIGAPIGHWLATHPVRNSGACGDVCGDRHAGAHLPAAPCAGSAGVFAADRRDRHLVGVRRRDPLRPRPADEAPADEVRVRWHRERAARLAVLRRALLRAGQMAARLAGTGARDRSRRHPGSRRDARAAPVDLRERPTRRSATRRSYSPPTTESGFWSSRSTATSSSRSRRSSSSGPWARPSVPFAAR